MAKSNGHQTPRVTFYKSYNFIDKDPVIDSMRALLANSGESYKDIHEDSGVSLTTLYNWFDGPTKRPQYATVMAFVRSLGYDLVLAPRQDAQSSKKATATVIAKRFPSAFERPRHTNGNSVHT